MQLRRALRTPSIEAVAHQTTPIFFNDLTLLMQSFIDTPSKEKTDPRWATVNKLIKEHTGILVDFQVIFGFSPNAYVIPPDIKKNHALFDKMRRDYFESKDLKKALRSGKLKNLKGSVDRKRHKVSGIFSEFECEMRVISPLLDKKKYTAAGVAAIVLHEIGHVFTYFEFLAQTLTTNYILTELHTDLLGTSEDSVKLELIAETEAFLEVPIKDQALVLSGEKGGEYLQVQVIEEYATNPKSSNGSDLYDMRNWEQLADQFATRLGAGKDLVIALDTLQRSIGGPTYWNSTVYRMLDVTVTLLYLPTYCIVLLLFILFKIDPNASHYDSPESRIKRIRAQLIDRLRKQSTSALQKQEIQSILESLTEIDIILAKTKDKQSLFSYLYTVFSPSGRKQDNKVKEQQMLEALANNELYVISAKFKQLK